MCSSIPSAYAAPDSVVTRRGGASSFGCRIPLGIAIQTSNGFWVPIPWKVNADRRQITPGATRRAIWAKLWCSVTGEFGSRYSPRPTRSNSPARCSRSRYSLATPMPSTSRGRTNGDSRASARTRSDLVDCCGTYAVGRICIHYAKVSRAKFISHDPRLSVQLRRFPESDRYVALLTGQSR